MNYLELKRKIFLSCWNNNKVILRTRENIAINSYSNVLTDIDLSFRSYLLIQTSINSTLSLAKWALMSEYDSTVKMSDVKDKTMFDFAMKL